ncbi:class I SAM-dependent methyltransferase [Tumebacillus lipolyticus]|uniref:Class I SAM-dependent methyltransferase n=1 Tax=Tumebacillus lipolyticus TaxID=1280370 RepID=A0ABW4ZSL4_9BACL
MFESTADSTTFDRWVFLSKFLSAPKQVGSILPSSQHLTRKMMSHVPWHEVDSIAELGAGTGVFTRAIYDRLSQGGKAIIFEYDDAMRDRLIERWPSLNYWSDATELNQALSISKMGELDCVISGLPFANFEQSLRDKLLDEVVSALRPGGLFIAFQYSLQMRKQLRQRFSSVKVDFVPLNVPPAFVYVCRK